MFSSSFTMSEQEHPQRTPYKHDAPAHSGRFALARPAARLLAHPEIRARPSVIKMRALVTPKRKTRSLFHDKNRLFRS
jgi:hypothetical protein